MSTLRQRFEAKVHRTPSCWIWTGAIVKTTGYGRINRGGRGAGIDGAHRVSYELFVGPIPAGTEIDHLCRNRACVRPEHLEAVPHRENVLRGSAPNVRLHKEQRCKNGHPASEAYLRPSTGAIVQCRTCRREREVSEKQLQQAIIDLARLHRWRIFHVFDARRSEAGFPDLTLAHTHHGLVFAELKSARGRATPAQLDWLSTLTVAGGERAGTTCESRVHTHIWRPDDWTTGRIEACLKGACTR